MRLFSSLLCGLLFGAGLLISGMTQPAKVLGFLDILGRWDPTLAFVMAGALMVTAGGYALARSGPVAGTDRFAHIGMKPNRIAFCQPLGIGAQIEIEHGPGFQPKCADDFKEDRRLRRFIDRKVKTLIEFDRARQIRRGQFAFSPHRLLRARNREQVTVRAMLRGLRSRMPFDRDPHLGQVTKLPG